MKFQLVSKNNVGASLTLLLIILLSQSNSLNFFINTYLGRTLLIALLLVVSYCNKILGVVFVLLIIIAFNTSNFGLYEGLTNPSTPPSKQSGAPAVSATSATSVPTTSVSATSTPTTSVSATSAPTTSAPTSSNPTATPPTSALSSAITNAPASVAGAFGSAAAPAPPAAPAAPTVPTGSPLNEGFSLIDTENNMKRGKQSNSINIYNNTHSVENVQPTDESVFSGLYSSF